MELQRLQRLVVVLRQVDADERLLGLFRMAEWIRLPHGCGTSACAFGHAALDPVLQHEGLAMSFVDRETGERATFTTSEQYAALVKGASKSFDAYPSYRSKYSFDAAVAFFGISRDAAEYLFDPGCYGDGSEDDITPGDVIQRIGWVIASDGERPD